MKMVFQWFYNAVAIDQTKAKAGPQKRKRVVELKKNKA